MHKIVLLILLVLPAWAACPTTWADYGYQKTITIANAQVSGTGTHTSFPVLVNIDNDANLKTTANGGNVQSSSGYDIAFYTPADGLLDYYRIKYDGGAAQGDLIAYVERDVSTSADTEICMRYGKAGASDLSSAANTFPLLVHYWPMESTNPSDVIGSLTSTSAGDTTTAAGQVSLGLTHDGAGDYSDTSSAGTNPSTLGDLAISAWLSMTDQSNIGAAFAQQDGGGTGRNWMAYTNASDKFVTTLGGVDLVSGVTVADTNLHFVAAEYDGTNVRLTVDGANETTAVQAPESAAGIYRIGRHKSLTTIDWEGVLDEVMIWSEDKGIDWWLTMYNNGSAPGTFYSVGTEATPASSGPKFRVQAIIGVLFWRSAWLLDYWQ